MPPTADVPQLQDAQQDLHDAKRAAHAHQTSLKERAHAFKRAQADVDQRLLAVTESDTSSDAVPRFEAVLDTLQRLDVANAYVQLLAEVDVLR
jgi:negative regulator of replication initiation